MSQETITLMWIIGGVILILAELIVPGLVIVFFGISAVIVGVANWLGAPLGITGSIAGWLLLSLLFVVIFRKLGVALFPSESSYQLVEEDVEALGAIVPVIKTVYADNNEGRIEFSGTSWPAISNNGIIPAGKKAKLLYRDNISWVIELYEE